MRERAAVVLLALAGLACSSRVHAPAERGAEDLGKLVPGPGVALERACVANGPETCFDARDDNCNGLIDEGCGSRTGVLQFSIAWSVPDADVDLEVTDPNGELAEPGRATEAGLAKERDCPGRDGCSGQNLENVYLESEEPLRGRYQIRVKVDKLGAAEPPLVVNFSARLGPKTYAARLEFVALGDERRLTLEL